MRYQSASRLILISLTAGLILLICRIDWKHAVSTDLLTLINSDDSNEQISGVARKIRDQLTHEVFLLIDSPQQNLSTDIAAAFNKQIHNQASFSSSACLSTPELPPDLTSFFHQHRMELLMPFWVRSSFPDGFSDSVSLESICDSIASRFDEFLSKPESAVWDSILANDPLLLTPDLMHRLESTLGGDPNRNRLLFSARRSSSQSREKTQVQLRNDLNNLRTWVSSEIPGASLIDQGFYRYAQESETLIRREIVRLNVLTQVFTLLIAFLFLRNPFILFPMIGIIGFSLGFATVVTILLFGQLHVIALVFGSILIGVAVDYGFHILLKREENRLQTFLSTLRAIWIPLSVSCLTTVAGFLILIANPVEAIRQIGCFVACGLVTALLCSALTAVAFDCIRTESFSRNLHYSFPIPYKKGFLWFLIGIAIVSLTGFFALRKPGDDVRNLQIQLQDSIQNEIRFNRLSGNRSGVSQWVTTASSTLQLLNHQRSAVASLDPQSGSRVANLSKFVPTIDEIQHFLSFRSKFGGGFVDQLAIAFEKKGYNISEFEEAMTAMRRFLEEPLTPDHWEIRYQELAQQLKYPLDSLLTYQDGFWWGISQMEANHPIDPSLSSHTFSLNHLQSINNTFTQYHHKLANDLIGTTAAIACILLFLFPLKRVLTILIIPCTSASAAALFSVLLDPQWSLFHLLGSMLGICITLDYAIFSSDPNRGNRPISIRMAALTTVGSFGILSTSQIPSLASLGGMVALITFLGWISTETVHSKTL